LPCPGCPHCSPSLPDVRPTESPETPPAPTNHVFPECMGDEKATRFSGAAVIKCLMTATGDARNCRVQKPL